MRRRLSRVSVLGDINGKETQMDIEIRNKRMEDP